MPVKLTKEQEKRTLRRIWDFFYWSKQVRDSKFMPLYRYAMRVYYDQTIDERGRMLLQQRGQSDVSINWLRIHLRRMQGYMTANRPQWAAFGVGDDDTKAAKLSNAILGHGWRISKGYLQVVDLIKKGVIGGLGLWSVYIDYTADNGIGEVKWRSLPVQFFYPDWRSMDPLYDDMAAQQVSYTVDLATAMSIVPKEYHDKLKKLSTVPENYDTLFEEGNLVYGQYPDPYYVNRVRLLTHYQLEDQPLWELKDLVDGETYYMSEKPDLPLPYAVDIRRVDVPSLVKYDCFYGMGEDDGFIYDITRFPYNKFLIKPFINEFMENAFPVGEAYFLAKMQNYYDKSLRVALQHEQWNSNPGVFIPQGSVANKKEFEEKVVLPGFALEIDMDDGKRPIFKQGVPGATGFYNIISLVQRAMQEATGNMFLPEMARGNATEDQLLKMTGQEHGDYLMRQFESTLEAGAEAYLMLARMHYDGVRKLFKFIDEKNRTRSVALNAAVVNDDGTVEEFLTKDIPTDVVIAARSYVPTEKFLTRRLLVEAMARSPQETVDILFVEFLKSLEIDPSIVEEAEARLQLLPVMQQHIQQLVQAVEELQQQNKELEGKLFSADRSKIKAEYEAQLEVIVKRVKTDLLALRKIYEERMKSNERILKSLNRETKEVANEGERAGQLEGSEENIPGL